MPCSPHCQQQIIPPTIFLLLFIASKFKIIAKLMIVPNLYKNHYEIKIYSTHTPWALLAGFLPNFYKVIWDLLNDDDSLDFFFVKCECEREKNEKHALRMMMPVERWTLKTFCLKKLKKEEEITSRNVRLDLIIAKCARWFWLKTDFGRWVCGFCREACGKRI